MGINNAWQSLFQTKEKRNIMIKFLIAGAAVVLFLIYLYKFKKEKDQSSQPEIQNEKNTTTAPIAPKIEPIIEPKTGSAVILTQQTPNNNAPQDSALRRHFVSHLRTMVESLQHTRPTDSTLSRHYDSVINAEIEQCVNDQGVLEQLISRYEDQKKTFVQPIEAPQTLAEPLIKTEVNAEPAKEPTVSQQIDIITEQLSVRPTDSTLARHYDTMINKTSK
ncbi:MAG: hypothetical protein RLZZ419_1609 [Pseudomonadota bacterium]|jgi:hypothetical protein